MKLGSATLPYGVFVLLDVGAFAPPPVVTGGVVGAGVIGSTFVFGCAGTGAVWAGGWLNVWSRIERGPLRRDEASDSRNARPINSPPHHQLILVSRLPACLVPRMASAELVTPPKLAAKPPPFPACSRMAATRITQSIASSVMRILESIL